MSSPQPFTTRIKLKIRHKAPSDPNPFSTQTTTHTLNGLPNSPLTEAGHAKSLVLADPSREPTTIDGSTTCAASANRPQIAPEPNKNTVKIASAVTSIRLPIPASTNCVDCGREQPSNRLLFVCTCAQQSKPPRPLHDHCLAQRLQRSGLFDQCPFCHQPLDPNRVRVRQIRPGLLRFLISSRALHKRIIQTPIYVGFLLYLTVLSMVQYAQAQPLVFRQWSILLLFLVMALLLLHTIAFACCMWRTMAEYRQFRRTNPQISIQSQSSARIV